MQSSVTLIFYIFFYALCSFASHSLSSASTVLSKKTWPSCYGKPFPDELIVKISLHLIPDFESPIHPEKIVENVYQLMQYRSVCKQVMHVVDQSIINTITLKKMHSWFWNENSYFSNYFFRQYCSYLNTPSFKEFFGHFAQFHESENELLSCFFEQKEPYGKWYQGGHLNEYEPWELLVKGGIVLKEFSELLKTRQFCLWKKLFELAMQFCKDDKRALIIMADQYCNYVNCYGKIGSFFDEWHDYCVSLVVEERIPNKNFNEIDVLEPSVLFKLEKIKAYFDCHSWLPVKKYSDLIDSFYSYQKEGSLNACYLIASVLSKVPLDRLILNESKNDLQLLNEPKNFLQLLKVLNQNLFHPSLIAQPVNYPLFTYNFTKKLQVYFVGNFYYQLVQELRNDNFFITAETLERQSSFMKDFFCEYKSLFLNKQHNLTEYSNFLENLLSFDPSYYYKLASDYKGIDQSLLLDKKSEEQLFQLQKSFYGFKLMLLYSFIVSIELPLVVAGGDSYDRHYYDESELRTLFEIKCVPFLDYIDDKKAHFLKKYFIEQQQPKKSLLQKIIKLLPPKNLILRLLTFNLCLVFLSWIIIEPFLKD